jgi:VIT1/CCC1 family predicted Fe2+/Mn2+ transporter
MTDENAESKVSREPRSEADAELDGRLNRLRAAVSGANDGIVSVGGLVMGVAGAGAGRTELIVAGVAAAVAGAISMGGAEYTSVSAARDSEIAHGRESKTTRRKPWVAAQSSAAAFAIGSVLPLVAILGPWQPYRIVATVGAVVVSLVITGFWAARAGKSRVLPSIVRNVVVSLLTMGIAYLIGAILGETLA